MISTPVSYRSLIASEAGLDDVAKELFDSLKDIKCFAFIDYPSSLGGFPERRYFFMGRGDSYVAAVYTHGKFVDVKRVSFQEGIDGAVEKAYIVLGSFVLSTFYSMRRKNIIKMFIKRSQKYLKKLKKFIKVTLA